MSVAPLTTPSAAPAAVGAIELGGTHVLAGLVDVAAGAVLGPSVRRVALDADAPAEEILRAVSEAAGHAYPRPSRWGVAIPGPFDYDAGVGSFAGTAKFSSLAGIELRAVLNQWIAPAAWTFLDDAEAFLLGEWRAGRAQGVRRCAAVTLGTGVGSAFLVEGRPLRDGPHVPPGGRLHRVSVEGVPLEERVSRRAIIAAYQRTGGGAEDVKEIAAAAGTDPCAAGVLVEAMRTLGSVLGPWLGRFGAECLVVGGSMVRAGSVVLAPLTSALTPPWDRPVLAAQHHELAALLGAAVWAERAVGATGGRPAGTGRFRR